MSGSNLTLDHVGVAVPDLEIGRQTYAALGFQLTPRSMHSGSVEPGGPVVPWGSGNHCAMLERGYVEVLGLVDAELHSSVKHLLQRYHGAHIVALRTPDAEVAHARFLATGIPARAPSTLQRRLDDENVLRFRNIYFDGPDFSQARFIAIEHQTPDLLWQPNLLEHPNTATSLRSVTIAVAPDDVEQTRALYSRAFPFAPQQNQAIQVESSAGLEASLPGPAPCVTGFEIGVRNIETCQAVLAANGVPHTRAADGSIHVPPSAAAGAHIMFTQD